MLETLEQSGSGAGQNLVSGSGAVSGCEKNWLEREQEVAERGTERGAGVTEIGLSDERKFCRSRSAHMLWSGIRSLPICGTVIDRR